MTDELGGDLHPSGFGYHLDSGDYHDRGIDCDDAECERCYPFKEDWPRERGLGRLERMLASNDPTVPSSLP